jgi:hypothetical protein
MSTATDHIPALETELALRGILVLLVADRQERQDRDVERAERILARAGLHDDEIASIIENGRGVARTTRPQSVIDRARETLTRAASTG